MTGGLWTPKLTGDFQEGDPSPSCKFYVVGKAEVKELSNHLRLYFEGIKIIQRPVILTNEIKEEITKQYRKAKRNPNKSVLMRLDDKTDEDEIDETDEEREIRLDIEKVDLEKLFKEETKKSLPLPKLYAYLSKKKPKSRMSDIHKTGSKIYITGSRNGAFGDDMSSRGDFYASLKDIPDALIYQGLAIVKLPNDEPKTDDPIIYSYVKFTSARHISSKSASALHLQEISDALSRLLSIVSTDPSSSTSSKTRKASENIRSLKHYRSITSKVWAAFGKEESEDVNFDQFLEMIDSPDVNIFIVETQAKRLFDSVDLRHDGRLTMFEFENFLMSFDVMGYPASDINILDIFDSLKTLPLSVDIEKLDISDNSGNSLQNEGNTVKSSKSGSVEVKSGNLEDSLPKTLKIDSSANPSQSQQKVVRFGDKFDEKLVKKNNVKTTAVAVAGLDYSGFCEALLVLNIKHASPEDTQRAFCHGGGINATQFEGKLLNSKEFKKAWLQLVDTEVELRQRSMKGGSSGLMGLVRARDRINRMVQDQEDAYFSLLGRVAGLVEGVKKDRREKKDARRREFEEFKGKVELEAKKFYAVRAQDKRVRAKLDQEEKAKRLAEERILRSKLVLRQEENRMAKASDIGEKVMAADRRQRVEIIAMGWDRLDLSVKDLREIPHDIYGNEDAQRKLSYLSWADFSRNRLETLPVNNFLFWMNDTKVLKLSQNRLQAMPEELGHMINLELLEMNINRLKYLPSSLGNLTRLERLDIASNGLEELPESIGRCASLRYLNAHSNRLTLLPNGLGSCLRLEYIDLSNNLIRELPTDTQFLIKLIHLDVNGNRIGALPDYIGGCTQLSYLDVSRNQLANLPSTFSQLQSLSYCNLQENTLALTPDNLTALTSLTYLNIHNNKTTEIHPDIARCTSISFLDLSLNNISTLPPDIGRLLHLERLILDRNNLKTIPPELLGGCKKILDLSVSYNSIEGCLSETIGLAGGLRRLDISFNKVDLWPRSILGLREIVSIKAEGCMLHCLPDTITYLDTLELLDLSRNRFKRFPIELKSMKALKTLDLSNNSLTLLPRSIHTMSFLNTLNLHNNALRALPPAAFTQILESVPAVSLSGNPWTDLPPKWTGTVGHEYGYGYSVPDALDFLYNISSIYEAAEDIWVECGILHYTQRLGLRDFELEIMKRLTHSWHDGFRDFVKHIYFPARESGIFPRWYSLDDDEDAAQVIAARERKQKQADESKRESNVVRSRLDLEVRMRRTEQAYDLTNLTRRAAVADRLAEEHRVNEAVVDRASLRALRACLVDREAANEKRRVKADRVWAGVVGEEARRLNSIVGADDDHKHVTWGKSKGKRMQLQPLKKTL